MAPVKKPRPVFGPHFLREWRNFRDIKQEDAAVAINLERGTLSKIEGRKSPYQQHHVEALAALYRCRPADLIGTDPFTIPSTPESELRSALLRFGIDASDLGRAVGIIRGFLDSRDEQPQEILPGGQSALASRRRAKEPSR